MNPFKVGDLVTRKSSIDNRIRTITSISNCGKFIKFKGSNYGNPFYESYELAEDTSKHHKHHDLIIAWAKGAKIQSYIVCDGWIDTPETPSWLLNVRYRVKPVEVTELEKLEAEYKELGEIIKKLKDGK